MKNFGGAPRVGGKKDFMARLFGTDGVRGIANVELTCEMAYRLGQAAAIYLGKTIVVGRDTRRIPATCWARLFPPAS